MANAKNFGRINIWKNGGAARAAEASGAGDVAASRITAYPTRAQALRHTAEQGGGSGDYVGPLDLVPGALVAYSTARALSATKRGSALFTLREDGGDTTQAFSTNATTGLLDASAITTFLDGEAGSYAALNDQSSNGLHLAQTDASKQPVFEAAANGGFAGMDFPSGEVVYNMESTATVDSPSPGMTVFMVVRGSMLMLLQDDPGHDYGYFVAGGLANFNIYDNDNENTAGGDYAGEVSDAAWHVIEITCAFGDNVFMVDGVASDENNDMDSGGAPGSRLALLALIEGSITRPSKFQEGLIYDGIVSVPNRLAIRQNIATFYGITLP